MEKTKRKTFARWHTQPMSKSFLVLFFKKEHFLSFLWAMRRQDGCHRHAERQRAIQDNQRLPQPGPERSARGNLLQVAASAHGSLPNRASSDNTVSPDPFHSVPTSASKNASSPEFFSAKTSAFAMLDLLPQPGAVPCP
jgi:hypothetical protein